MNTLNLEQTTFKTGDLNWTLYHFPNQDWYAVAADHRGMVITAKHPDIEFVHELCTKIAAAVVLPPA